MASARLRLTRHSVVGAVAVVAVVGAGTSAWALSGGSSTSYRTAVVSRGAVTQQLTATGTITPVRDADLDFQVAGTVAKVLAKPGDRVSSGQRVAVLDRTSLTSAVRSARATLNNARAELVSDENNQASAASTPTTSGSSTPTPTATKTPKASPSPTGPSGSTGSVSKQLLAKIRRDQSTLLAAQQQADADLATAKSALKAATTACSAAVSGTTTDGTDSDDGTACVAAAQALLADQQAVAADQQAVSKAEGSLNADLSAAVGSVAPTAANDAADSVVAGSSTSAVHAVTAVAVTPRSAAAQVSAPIGSTVTAATLASDQATIDTDRATLATAKSDLAQATLRSAINGRVMAITVAKGDRVSGSSSTISPAVKVVGSRQTEATVDVTAAQVRQIKTGMSATVIPDGSSTALAGTVLQIGQASTDSTTGATTYPVAIAMSSHPTNLVSGAQAQVSIALSSERDVVVVPTSAVHRSGSRSYVETLAGGRVSRRTVTVGAVGSDVTQILSGLTVGQRVVLADLNAAVPSSSTNLLDNRSGVGGGNSFTKGGFSGGPTFSGPPPGAVIIQR